MTSSSASTDVTPVMSARETRIYSTSEWDAVKPIIKQRYIMEKMTANTLVEYLEQHHGFKVSTRQLKLRLGQWGWRKKLNDVTSYWTMNYICEQHPRQRVTFHIPRPSGEVVPKPGTEVVKECVRKRATAARGGLKGIPAKPASVPQALASLQAMGITVEIDPSSDPSHPRHDSGDETDSSESVRNVGSSRRSEEMDLFSREIEELTGSNSLDSGATSLNRHTWSSRFAIELPPQTTGRNFRHHFTRAYDMFDPYVSSGDELTKLLAEMTLSLDSSDTRRKCLERFLGLELGRAYKRFDPDYKVKVLVEFTGYYVMQSVRTDGPFDHHDHPDRVEARRKLAEMLSSGNDLTLIGFHWVNNVIGSSQKIDQLQAFLGDCWEVASTDPSPLAQILRPPLKFSWMMHSKMTGKEHDDSFVQEQRELLQNSSLYSELCQSIQILAECGHDESPTSIIMQTYVAWYLEKVGRHDESLARLAKMRGVAEKVLGDRHLVTLSCMYMYARGRHLRNAYDDRRLAVTELKIVISRLSACASPIRSFQHRMIHQLAKFMRDEGKFTDCADNLEKVLKYRVDTLGASHRDSKDVFFQLFDVHKLRGRHDQAEALEQEFGQLVRESESSNGLVSDAVALHREFDDGSFA